MLYSLPVRQGSLFTTSGTAISNSLFCNFLYMLLAVGRIIYMYLYRLKLSQILFILDWNLNTSAQYSVKVYNQQAMYWCSFFRVINSESTAFENKNIGTQASRLAKTHESQNRNLRLNRKFCTFPGTVTVVAHLISSLLLPVTGSSHGPCTLMSNLVRCSELCGTTTSKLLTRERCRRSASQATTWEQRLCK